MNNTSTTDKPRAVVRAVRLFAATIGFALVKLGITVATPAPGASHGVAIVSFIAVYVLMALTIVYINQGAGWARGVMAVLFLLGIAPALPIVFMYFTARPILAGLTLAQTAAQVVGLFLVYSEPGAIWFKRTKTV